MMGSETVLTSVLASVLAIAGGGGAPVAQPTRPELPGGAVSVSMSRVDGQVVVPVSVDGQGPFLFRIDTGSSVSLALDAALANQLGLVRAGEASTGFAIESLELGGATFRDVAATVRDSASAAVAVPAGSPVPLVQGVLGFPFFHDVLLTIDYAAGTVELQQGSLSAETEGVVPLVGALDTPQVPLQIGDHVYLARIDTGFAASVRTSPIATSGSATLSARCARRRPRRRWGACTRTGGRSRRAARGSRSRCSWLAGATTGCRCSSPICPRGRGWATACWPTSA